MEIFREKIGRRAMPMPSDGWDNSMRVVLAVTASVFLLAADGSALAASGCSKGMLWPYVRNPGDCLTDAELKAGQIGVYNGPVNTNPDVAGIHPVAPVQNGPVTGGKTSAPAPATAGATTRAGNGPATASIQRNTEVACRKGAFWPFVRSPGDCLTDIEKKNGQTGVFGGGAAPTVTPVSTASVSTEKTDGAAPPSANGSAASTATATNDTTAAAPEPACNKGLLWPFVRRPGDCPTDAEKKRRN